MKKILMKGIFLLLLFAFAGCLEVKTIVSVNTDGSGTMTETVLMNKEVVKMLAEFSKMGNDSASSKPFSLFNEQELKNKASKLGEGVQYVSGSPIKSEDKEGYKVVYSFTNLNSLKIDENPEDKVSVGKMGSGSKSKKETLHFNFKEGTPSEITIKLPKSKPAKTSSGTEDTLNTEKNNPEMMKMMRDLHVSLSLHINGDITNTNADYVNGNDITIYDIDFNKLLKNKKDLKLLNKINLQNFEELEKLMKNTPGIKMQLKSPVNIQFE